jgi:hypothetical protein
MREAETVLGVLRERGRRGLPVERLYRLLFNPRLYLLAYQRLYANAGAMTAGSPVKPWMACPWTRSGVSLRSFGPNNGVGRL